MQQLLLDWPGIQVYNVSCAQAIDIAYRQPKIDGCRKAFVKIRDLSFGIPFCCNRWIYFLYHESRNFNIAPPPRQFRVVTLGDVIGEVINGVEMRWSNCNAYENVYDEHRKMVAALKRGECTAHWLNVAKEHRPKGLENVDTLTRHYRRCSMKRQLYGYGAIPQGYSNVTNKLVGPDFASEQNPDIFIHPNIDRALTLPELEAITGKKWYSDGRPDDWFSLPPKILDWVVEQATHYFYDAWKEQDYESKWNPSTESFEGDGNAKGHVKVFDLSEYI